MLTELRTLLNRLTCLFLDHQTLTYGPIMWMTVGQIQDVPVYQAFCRRCYWRGYRTTWGMLVKGRVDG